MMLEDEGALARNLMEIGYMAVSCGQFQHAETIFRGVSALRPENESPWIGMALLRMNLGRNEEGIKLLREEALKRNPASDEAKGFLGLALRRGGYNAESFNILTELAGSRRESPAREMARELLKEIKN